MRIYLDLEATEGGEIIAIGAVAENGKRFFSAIRPRFTPVTPRIAVLTGITADEAEEFPLAETAIPRFVNWVLEQDTGLGIVFLTFGENDKCFAKKTLAFYKEDCGTPDSVLEGLSWLIANMSDCSLLIHKAFRRPNISLRSAYLTLRETELSPIHNPVEDALALKELIDLILGGWTLPENATVVKATKPNLPPKMKEIIPENLNRKVVAYWVQSKTNKDMTCVFSDCVKAATTLCGQAIQQGQTDKYQVATRVLNAAITGESYCGRKFFLVD